MKHHWIWILLILFISGCGQGYDWGWYVVSPLHPQGQTNIQFLISGLWYTLDSCLSKTTPAFVYTLRAADAAGVHGGVPTPGLALALTLVLALALALARSSLRRSGSCP